MPKERDSKKRKTQKKYQLEQRDIIVIKKQMERLKDQSSARIKIDTDGGIKRISHHHPDPLVGIAHLNEALGTADEDFKSGIISQLIAAGPQSPADIESRVNFMLSVIKGTKSNDQFETMLAAQMASVHLAFIRSANHLMSATTIEHNDSAERTLNKLARTFTTQIEALKRYRTGGEQKVLVQHVSVSEGGQAIVGNVTQAPKASEPGRIAASPLAITDKKTAPMSVMGERQKLVCVPTRNARTRR